MKQGRDADVAGISRTVLALTKYLHLALTVWIHTDTCISVSRRDTRVEIFEICVPAHIYRIMLVMAIQMHFPANKKAELAILS